MAKREGDEVERSYIEAGMFGWAVLSACAGAVLMLVPFLVALLGGSFAWDDYYVGGVALVFAGTFWGMSRLSRVLAE